MVTRLPISVLVPTRNEARNLPRVLERLGWAGEIVVVDSQSDDGTAEIAREHGAAVLEFVYEGGWPKKRQWALDNYAFVHQWVLLLDADEIVTDPLRDEIAGAIRDPTYVGYYIRLQIHFLGRQLRHGDTELWKLNLFRTGKGRFERRLHEQDASMSDMEVHEHVVVDGPVRRLREPIRHENLNSIEHYIAKHNTYSNWEARVLLEGGHEDLPPRLCGNQAQRRRWLKRHLIRRRSFPLLVFLYRYCLRLGFLDGYPGFLYLALSSAQMLHVQAKIYELELAWRRGQQSTERPSHWTADA